MMMDMQKFLIETSLSGTLLKSVINRYTPQRTVPPDSEALVLVFTHGTGFHKEHWEIPIQRLFLLASEQSGFFIREAWSIDAQTHGEAAELNRETTAKDGWEYTIEDYADACSTLYNTHIGPTKHPKDKVVLIGHSAGAASAALSTSFYPDRAPFAALIMVEPAIWTEDMTGIDTPIYELAVMTIPARRDNWPSKEAAHQYLAKRAPWSMWDARMLAVYVEHGLRVDSERGGVTLRCSPKEESTPFRNAGNGIAAVRALDKTSKYMPVHLVYGERNDMFAREKQDSLLRDGRKFASISRVPECGHLWILQEAPDALADVIFDILVGKRVDVSSKL
ncbi:alpha/beta-hydrolase [Hymenopellis radicata]|nr:alpha/beta-hydrolase [Hymenopellis radicata]